MGLYLTRQGAAVADPRTGENLMTMYTYTIFDANPHQTSGTAWPTHSDLEIEADSDEEALGEVRDVMSIEAAGLNEADGYDVGQTLYAFVWQDGIMVGEPTYDLTIEDLDPPKSAVEDWETVCSYVATYESGDGEGACDVDVQVGEAHGAWFVRTRDEAGGADDAPDTAYATRAEAETAASEFAEGHDEGDGKSAESYLRNQLESRAGDPDPDGEWCVYWETSLDDGGPRARYETEDQATAAAELAQQELEERHPGGRLLCGFEVRRLVDGEWVRGD